MNAQPHAEAHIGAGRGLVAAALVATALRLATPAPVSAGAYIFAGETNGLDLITHATGYTGIGGTVSLGVCIDPTSSNAVQMEISVQNIVTTLNALMPVHGNLVIPSPKVPSGEVDFESVALHEVGHCIGMAHVNAASESGLSGSDRNYTKAADGSDNIFNLGAGADGVRGSGDDVRGDDLNLHWFQLANNDPFTIASTVDSTTYARDTTRLPDGDTFAANADRTVATLPRYDAAGTESVMQQGSFFGEEQRRLNHDDVATLRYARAGLDSLAGTADDYVVTMVYEGLTTSCDIVLDFDNTRTGFAVCQTSGGFLSSDDAVITSARAYFNTQVSWFFNDQLICPTDDATFADQTVTGPATLAAELSVTLGPSLTVDGTSGAVEVRASQAIAVLSGTSISGEVELETVVSPCS